MIAFFPLDILRRVVVGHVETGKSLFTLESNKLETKHEGKGLKLQKDLICYSQLIN